MKKLRKIYKSKLQTIKMYYSCLVHWMSKNKLNEVRRQDYDQFLQYFKQLNEFEININQKAMGEIKAILKQFKDLNTKENKTLYILGETLEEKQEYVDKDI